jgi:ABC-2 type transport system permease protein
MKWMNLAGRNLKETWRDPLSLGLGVAMPCVLIALFASLGKNAPVAAFQPASLAPSLAVFSFAFLIMFSAMLLSKDRSSGLFGRLRATPLAYGDFVLAYCLPYLPFGLLQALACHLAGIALGAPLGPGTAATFIILVPMAASCTGIGLVLGALCTENQIAGLGSALVSAIGFLGGSWFDLGSAGGFFAFMGRYFPFARAVEGSRLLFSGAPIAEAMPDIAIAWGFAALCLAAAAACIRTRTKP